MCFVQEINSWLLKTNPICSQCEDVCSFLNSCKFLHLLCTGAKLHFTLMNEWKWWMKSLRECVSSKCTAGKSHLESLWRKYEGQSCFVFVLCTQRNCRVSSCISAVLAMVRWQLALWENCKDTAAPVLLRKLQRYSSFCSVEKIAKILQLLFCWEKLLVSPSLKACAALHYSWQQFSLTVNTHTKRLAWRQHGRVAQTLSSGLRGYRFESQFRLTFFPLSLVLVWLVQWRRLPPQPSLTVPGAVTQTSPSAYC